MQTSKPTVTGIAASVNLQKRSEIDAAFAKMVGDSGYQKESLMISDEFAQSGWEALEAGERES